MDHSIASVTKFASDTHRHLLARTQPPSHTKHTSFSTIFATESNQACADAYRSSFWLVHRLWDLQRQSWPSRHHAVAGRPGYSVRKQALKLGRGVGRGEPRPAVFLYPPHERMAASAEKGRGGRLREIGRAPQDF